MKRILIVLALLLPMALLAQEQLTIYYAENESALSLAQTEELNAFIAAFGSDTIHIKIAGSADSKGTEQANRKLVAARIKNMEKLMAAFPNVIVDFTENYGESYPVIVDGQEQFDESRFALIEVLHRKPVVISDRVIAPKSISADRFFAFSQPRTQRIPIDTRRKQKLEGIDGTFVTVYPGALETVNGEIYKGRAVVSLREYYSYDQMLADSLHTMAGNNLLETGGMVYLDIKTENGDPLTIKRKRFVHIGMPTDSVREGMQVFRTKYLSERKMTWYAQQEKSQAKVSYIEIEDGMKYKVVDSPGDVTRSMGIETFDGYKMKSVPVYGLDVSGFGMINCDRFLQIEDKRDLHIAFADSIPTEQVSVYILFSEMKSIMTGLKGTFETEFVFPGVPREMPSFICAYRNVNGEILTATYKITDDQSSYFLDFEPTNLNLKETLASMD